MYFFFLYHNFHKTNKNNQILSKGRYSISLFLYMLISKTCDNTNNNDNNSISLKKNSITKKFCNKFIFPLCQFIQSHVSV